MKNNISYYTHQVGSHSHPKFKTLRAKYGWTGEGRFWALNNLAGQAENCRLDISKKYNKGTLAVDLGMTIEELDEFIDYLVNVCELFRYEDGCLTNDTLQENLEVVMIAREKARERKEGGSKKSSCELRKSSSELSQNTKSGKSSAELSKSSHELNQSSCEQNKKVKESKVKESKGEISAHEPSSPATSQEESECSQVSLFEQFWTAYPNKRSRDRAEAQWLNLRVDEDLFGIIMAALDKYKKTKQWKDPDYIPFAHNWLRNRRYFDDLGPELEMQNETEGDYEPMSPCHIIYDEE